MSDTILFRGAVVRYFDVRQSAKGEGMWVNIHMSSDFSEPLREAMDWEDLPASYHGGALDGDLAGVEMFLNPDGKQMKQHALKLAIRSVSDFNVVELKQKDKDPERQLQFKISTNSDKAHVYLGNYLKVIGRGAGQLKISYSEQAELAEAEDKQEKLISESQAKDTEGDD
jgi:hypothetical protein